MEADTAYRFIHAWLKGDEHDLRAFEALDELWLAAKLQEDPTFDWTAPRPLTCTPTVLGESHEH